MKTEHPIMPKMITPSEIIFQLLKYPHNWITPAHVILYSDNIVELETGAEKEIIAEYKIKRSELKKFIKAKGL